MARLAMEKPFPFLKLPRELRDMVYELLLVLPAHERYLKDDEPGTDELKKRFSTLKLAPQIHEELYIKELPAILHVCHQIQDEANELFWTKIQWRINLHAKNRSERYTIASDLSNPDAAVLRLGVENGMSTPPASPA